MTETHWPILFAYLQETLLYFWIYNLKYVISAPKHLVLFHCCWFPNKSSILDASKLAERSELWLTMFLVLSLFLKITTAASKQSTLNVLGLNGFSGLCSTPFIGRRLGDYVSVLKPSSKLRSSCLHKAVHWLCFGVSNSLVLWLYHIVL